MNQKSLINIFLENYSKGLINEDANLMASIFHSGLAYIVNDEARLGSETLCIRDTWLFIFSKIKFLDVFVSNINEPYNGVAMYHEKIVVQSKVTKEIREGHFGDLAVINKDGKMILVNRLADPNYYNWFEKVIAL